ncbi:hypothetical protein [Nocardioides lianchengensis]|uniref:Uncharacterized protein n=1 Tax=Nocardioides lianchengensis TaxID=1045774 RepID=A0A1G6UTK7_9ACTN|nr:hypothetical protein [Nocardioides lianchengensis]NYG11014.1 hypothetical protein [Nocardioides lianchengensis]SDD43875.1 hypothetical protein SAMN05421872_10867 [Nocardioides lianchengensis]
MGQARGNRTRRRSRLGQVGRWVALLVTLAGLFAMHGMADHGTASHGAMPGMGSAETVVTTSAPTTPHGEAHPDMRAAPSSEQIGPADGGTHEQPEQMGLLGLCLAILAALFALCASRMWALGRTMLAALLPAGRSTAPGWFRARDPVPPDLFQLSIQRC